jgi:hypothetical protein
LTGRNLLPEAMLAECGERMKEHILQQPEWKKIEAYIMKKLANGCGEK